jgi:hypothetical protein
MEWATPRVFEIKMDAEIGSYQEDGDYDPITKPLTHLVQRDGDMRDVGE